MDEATRINWTRNPKTTTTLYAEQGCMLKHSTENKTDVQYSVTWNL